jgi:glycerophosphoryl diester phosphodiesterase
VEHKRLDAGAKFKARNLTPNPFPRGKGDNRADVERVPTLDEVFDVTSGKCGLNIELKAAGVEPQVAQIMQARNAFGDSIVSSFDWDYLRTIQQLHFNIRVGLLAEEKPVDLMMNAVAMRAHSINPRWDMVTADLCKAAHERGLKVYTWTVDADARMRALIECGVDGIMTNYPERLRKVLGG